MILLNRFKTMALVSFLFFSIPLTISAQKSQVELNEAMRIKLDACYVTLSEWNGIEVGDKLGKPIDLRAWGFEKPDASDFFLPIEGKETAIDLYGILKLQFSSSWEAWFTNPAGNLNEFHATAQVIRYEYVNNNKHTLLPEKREFVEILLLSYAYSKTKEAVPVGPASLIRIRCDTVTH